MNLPLIFTQILTSIGFMPAGDNGDNGFVEDDFFSSQLRPQQRPQLRPPFGNISPPGSIESNIPIKNSPTCGLSRDNSLIALKSQDDNSIHMLSHKIVGGHEAFPGEFAWQVSIQKFSYFQTVHFCGGTLISPNWVLTAAHCTDGSRSSNRRSPIRVVSGAHQITPNSPLWSPPKTVKRIIIHPKFNMRRGVNDIALLELDSSINIPASNGMVNTVCLPTKGQEFTGIATTAGWGRINERGPNSMTMLAVDVPIIDQRQCQRVYQRNYKPETMLCAGETGKDSCQGDSGGGLIHRDASGRATIIGVVSVGNGCGRTGFPGIYTRVSSFTDWIMKNIN